MTSSAKHLKLSGGAGTKQESSTATKESISVRTIICSASRITPALSAAYKLKPRHSTTRYLFLVESWKRHNFVADLRNLFPQHLLYRVGAGSSSGILIDKLNAMNYSIVCSDREIRRHKRIG
jgi:hypothetical protein